MENPIVKTIKEGLRIALFAAITAVIAWLGEIVAGLDPNTTFYIVGTVVLRLADKWIHEANNRLKGIAPF